MVVENHPTVFKSLRHLGGHKRLDLMSCVGILPSFPG
jgi:hypothetical protein